MTQDLVPTAPADAPDKVDRMLEVWARELPELDLATEGIAERIQFLYRHLDRTLGDTLAGKGLSFGEWKLLGALRYSGPPYRQSPGQLAEHLGLSSGAMTNRLDRMERAGLIRRLPDPDDRRALQVEVTEDGWQLWQDTVGTQAEKEALIASVLDDGERVALNGLLRRLMHAFDQVHGPLRRKPAD